MKRLDTIYRRTRQILQRPETKKRLTLGTVILVIIAVIFSSLINFFPDKNVQASPGTRTKTVEFYVGQNYSTTGIASGTGATYDFTAYLPDAITSATVVRSAYIEYNTVISALDSTATAFQLGLVGSLTTLSSPAIIDTTGESQPVQMKLDSTAKLQSIIQAAGTFNLRFTTSITGPVRYGENARLLITYDYNDAAATQVKTVYAWVHSQAATVASAGTVTSANFNLGLPESTITSQSAWMETRGYVYIATTTGFNWNAETQRDIAWPNTTNSYGYVALVSPTTTYSPNTNNTFTIKSVTGAFSAPSAIVGYTYSFNYSASTELMNSLKTHLYQGTETASTATLSGNYVINLPEASITMKSSFLQGRAVNTNTAAMTSGINAQLGSTPTTTGINFLANAAETDGFRTIIWDVTSNLSTMANGDNTVYWAYATSAATNIRGLTLYLNYKYNKAATTNFNFQAEYHVGQQTAASTTWSQAFTPSIADSSYTLKSSHLNTQFNENAATVPTSTVGITTTGAYLFVATGENVMGEVWRDTSSDVTTLGSQLTATLNNDRSSTKSASFLVWWQASFNTAPNSPSSMAQKKTDDTVLATGDWTNETSVKFTATASDPDNPDTLQLCVEKDILGTGFSNTEDACGTGVAYSGTPVTVTVTISGITDAQEYHWQARVKDAAGAYSGWVSYDVNPETARDFGVDTTAPTGGTVNDGTGADQDYNNGTLDTLSANWSGIDSTVSGLLKYEYAIGTTQGGTDVVTWADNGVSTSVTSGSLTLRTGQKYYFTIRTTDNATNVSTPINSNGQEVLPQISFTLNSNTVDFANLNSGNNWTDTKTSTFTTSTNAYNGYIVRVYITDLLRSLAYSSITIPNFQGTYSAPETWSPPGDGKYGFGYSTSDCDVNSGLFWSGGGCTPPQKFAAFSQTASGDTIADRSGPITGSPITNETFTITYRVAVQNSQAASSYRTYATYIVVSNF